jgi:hypothetical protein
MNPRQSDASVSNLPKVGLAACISGLVLSPFGYIAMGALADFAPAFSWIALPPLLASSGYLLVRFWATQGQRASSRLALVAACFAWLVIAGFLAVVSGFALLTGLERIGLFATVFLAASLLSLPVFLLRRTALEERLKCLPQKFALLALLAILTAAAVAMGNYLLRTPVFL